MTTVRGITILLIAAAAAGLLALGAQRTAYTRGQEALDRQSWSEAVRSFDEAIAAGGDSADDALYWKAYALRKLERVDDAMATLERLRRTYPDSAWIDEARALQAEIEGARGRRTSRGGDETTLVALSALAASGADDPRIVDSLRRFIAGDRPLEQKERALFVLMQSGAPGTFDAVVDLATDADDPALRAVAVRQLGVFGDERATAALERLYGSTRDTALRLEILNAFMVSGDAGPVLAAARADGDARVRTSAINLLGVMGETDELDALYGAEGDPAVREAILQAYMVAGDSDALARAAREERSDALRLQAVRLLGANGATGELATLYGESSEEVRGAILEAYMIAGDRGRVLEAAGSESAVELRLRAVQLLGVMDAADDLMTLWRSEGDAAVRRGIVQALAIAGGSDELSRIAREDADPTNRVEAVRAMGIAGHGASDALAAIYESASSREVRVAAIDGLFMAGAVQELLRIARTETDPDLRAVVVQRLALTGSDEVTEFMLELLDE